MSATPAWEKTDTAIGAHGGCVVLRYSRPVGTQVLTPAQARGLAEMRVTHAEAAEAQRRHVEN